MGVLDIDLPLPGHGGGRGLPRSAKAFWKNADVVASFRLAQRGQ